MEKLCDLYGKNPKYIDEAFNEMYQIGKPEVRKYCTPLQALFWLFEDNKVDSAEEFLNKYQSKKKFYLKDLLSKGWIFQEGQGDLSLTTEQVLEIATNHVTDKNLGHFNQSRKRTYRNNVKNYHSESNPEKKIEIINTLKSVIHMDYKIDKGRFSRSARKVIKEAIQKEHGDPRWDDYDTVIERLNAPELVEAYMAQNFMYRRTYRPQTAKTTIKTGKGDCKAYAIVSYRSLKHSGYKTYLYTMDLYSPTGHTICVIEIDGKLYALDNRYGLSGPFRNREQIDNKFGFAGYESLMENLGAMFGRFH